jgi:hypothetical protein
MAESVLESFVIKLGYQIDQASAKRFITTITDGLKGVLEFSGAIMGMAVAAEEAVRRTAAQMARLSFAATMGGTTVNKLREVGYAVEAVGGSYQDLIGAQVSLNQKLTEAPWMKGMLHSMLHGHSMDMDGIIKRYHELSSGPLGEASAAAVNFSRVMREQYGVNMQIAEQSHRHWKEFADVQEHNRQVTMLFRKEMDQAEANSVKMQSSWTKLGFTVDTMWKSVTGGLSGILSHVFDKFDEWLQTSAPEINKFMEELNPLIDQITTDILNWMDDIVKHPEKVKKAWDDVKAFVTNTWDNLKQIYQVMHDAVCALAGAFHWLSEKVGGDANAAIILFLAYMGRYAIIDTFAKAVGGLASSLFGVATQGAAANGILRTMGGLLMAGGGIGAGIVGLGAVMALFYSTKDWMKKVAPISHSGPVENRPNYSDKPWYERIFGIVPGSHESTYHRGGKPPGMQQGGIVPINAHAGEMVLPSQISTGLQSLFMSGGLGDSMEDLSHWLMNDSSFQPFVTFATEVYDKLTDAFEEALVRVGGTGGGAGGGAGGDGGGASPDGGGATPDQGGPAGAGAISQKAAELISRAEGTFTKAGINYNAMYSGEMKGLTEMTIAKVMEYQRQHMGSHTPIGAFQMTRDTIADTIKALHLDPETTKFSPEVQRQLAGYLLQHRGIQPWTNQHPELMRQVKEMGAGAFETQGTGGGGSVGKFGKGSSTALLEIMNQAFTAALPSGYSVRQTSGARPGGDPSSGHYRGKAADFEIIGPDGKAIPNEGADRSGLYRKVAIQAYLAAMQKYGPEMAKQLGWGGHFGSHIHGGGAADLMHFDWLFKGIRGKIGNMYQEYNEALKLFQTQRQNMQETVRRDQSDIKYGTGLKSPTVDNSTNVTNIHGVTDPHGVARVTADLGDRRSSYRKQNQRTYVS